MDESKNILKSKTFWLNLAMMVGTTFIPHAGAFVSAHPAVATGIATGINIANRVLGTTQPVTVFGG